MFASVIPAVRLPRNADSYDYKVPDAIAFDVHRGSLVMVPWRGRDVHGLVREVRPATDVPEAKVKEVSSLRIPSPVGADLMDLVEWMGPYYYASMGTVLRALLPAPPKRRAKDEAAVVPAAERDARPIPPRRLLVRYASVAEKMRELEDLIGPRLDGGRNAVVIAPHAEDVDDLAARLRATLGDDRVIAYHGGLAPTALWRAWSACLAASGRVVVGTRMAVAAPLPRLGALAVVECESRDLKQYDQNPRFDARLAAARRADAARADLAFLGHAPRLEETGLIDASPDREIRESAVGEPDVTLVGLPPAASALEKALTPSAEAASVQALRAGKRVLIFHNRRGAASALICRDCRRAARCVTCGVAERVHDASLHCHRCGTSRPLPLTCPSCGGPSLAAAGVGTAGLAAHAAQLFPEATITRMDADVRARSGRAAELGDVLIGTQQLLHDIAELEDAPNLGAVVATDVDDLLAHADFRTAEDAWRTIRTLKDLAAADKAPLILQALDAEDMKVRSLLAPRDAFAADERKDRAAIGYPPAATMIAITARDKSEREAERKAAGLIAGLRQHAESLGVASALGPIRPSSPFRHGMWRSVAVIRLKGAPNAAFDEVMQKLPEDYIVDRDPVSLA